MPKKHIVIDARIRQSSTGRPVEKLLEYLQKTDTPNYRFTFILNKKDPWKPTKKSHSIKKVSYKNFSMNPLSWIGYATTLYRLKADLVYFTLTPQQPFLYFKKQVTFTHDLNMLLFTRNNRTPIIVHNFKMLGYKFLLWQAHKKAAVTIAPTQYVADTINKRYLFTNRKTQLIYEASDPPLAVKATEPENKPGEFIMYTGLAFPHKNLERLVSAFCLLKEHHPNLKLVLIGKREYYSKKLEKWIAKNTQTKDVVFTGFIPDEELKWYYENTLAYVFPSMAEGFGLPALEAMVHGAPVVSTNTTCLPELCGDGAHYFNPYDVPEMAQKIDEVISSKPLRNKLVAAGYENVKKYSWGKFTRELLGVFDDVLKD